MMTGSQLRIAMSRLGFTQIELALFLGVEERSVQRWVAGRYGVPTAVAKLLLLMLGTNTTPDTVDAMAATWNDHAPHAPKKETK